MYVSQDVRRRSQNGQPYPLLPPSPPYSIPHIFTRICHAQKPSYANVNIHSKQLPPSRTERCPFHHIHSLPFSPTKPPPSPFGTLAFPRQSPGQHPPASDILQAHHALCLDRCRCRHCHQPPYSPAHVGTPSPGTSCSARSPTLPSPRTPSLGSTAPLRTAAGATAAAAAAPWRLPSQQQQYQQRQQRQRGSPNYRSERSSSHRQRRCHHDRRPSPRHHHRHHHQSPRLRYGRVQREGARTVLRAKLWRQRGETNHVRAPFRRRYNRCRAGFLLPLVPPPLLLLPMPLLRILLFLMLLLLLCLLLLRLLVLLRRPTRLLWARHIPAPVPTVAPL